MRRAFPRVTRQHSIVPTAVVSNATPLPEPSSLGTGVSVENAFSRSRKPQRLSVGAGLKALLTCASLLLTTSTAKAGNEPPNPPPCGPTCQQATNGQISPTIEPTAGDPVSIATGLFDYNHVDLRIPGRGMDLVFERTYRNGSSVETPLGPKWDFNWNQSIVLEYGNIPDPKPPGPHGSFVAGGQATGLRVVGAFYYNGGLRIDRFTHNVNDHWTTPKGYFAKLRSWPVVDLLETTPSEFILRSADGTILTFADRDFGPAPFVAGVTYRMSQIEDRSGNRIRFRYEDILWTKGAIYKRLNYVIDTLGRVVDLHYDDAIHPLRLTKLTDFSGREVTFEYDANNNLASVTSPAVSGTPTGNDFPGPKVRYEYEPHALESYVLTKIFDPLQFGSGGVPYLHNTYDGAGRVTKQLLPNGGVHAFIYKNYPTPELVQFPTGGFQKWQETLHISPNGDLRVSAFDREGRERLRTQWTGRFNPADVGVGTTIEQVIAARTAKLRATDPSSYETQKDYNNDGLVTEIRAPGSKIRNTYDTSTDAFRRGNVLKTERFPVPDEGQKPLTQIFAYEPIYNQIRAEIEPRGADATHVPLNGSQYLRLTHFDYQEKAYFGNVAAGLVQTWAIDTNQTAQFALLASVGVTLLPIPRACGLDDLNGDVTPQEFGNRVLVTDPTAQVFQNPASSSTLVPQVVATKYRYNPFSLFKEVEDPRGHITSFEYFSEADPDGVAPPTTPPSGMSLSSTAGTNGGGFLSAKHYPEAVIESFGYDMLGRRTRHVNGRGAETTTTYNQLDDVVQVENDAGYVSQNIYDGACRVVSKRRTNKLPVFDAQGLPTSTEQNGASGAFISDNFEYDVVGNLITEDIQANGSSVRLVTRHRYDRSKKRVITLLPELSADPASVVSTIFDERGLVWKVTRGGLDPDFSGLTAGMATQGLSIGASIVTSPLWSTKEMKYDGIGNETTMKDGEGHVWPTSYDAFGRLVKTTDPLGNTIEKILDSAGNELEVITKQVGATDPIGHVKNRFDELGRRYQTDEKLVALGVTATLPDGPLSPGDGFVTTRTLYDAAGNATQSVDDNLAVTTKQYDDLNRVELVTDALANQIVTAYDKAGNAIRIESVEWNDAHTSTQSFVTRHFYDMLNRKVAVVDNLGQTSRFAYDSRGNQVFNSDPKSVVVNVLLSTLDATSEHGSLPGLFINGHGNTTRSSYDDANRLKETILHMRSGGMGGNAIDVTQADDGQIITTKSFDKNGRLISQVDDHGNVTGYAYDALDRLVTTTFEDGTSEVLTHYKNDLVHTRTDANGTVTTNTYDVANRLTSKSIALGTGVIGTTAEVMTYDGASRMLTGSDDDSSLVRNYDSLGHVIQETLNSRTTTSIYDGVGNLKSTVYPSGRRIVRSYDGLNRLLTVKDAVSGTNLAEYRYAGQRRVESRDYPISGARLLYSYDGAKRVNGTEHLRISAGTTIDQRSFTWDRASNKTSRLNLVTGLLHEYDYDSGYQLVASHRSGASTAQQDITYGLDGVGNRHQVTGGPLPGPYTLNASAPPADLQMNQYTSIPGTSNLHDPAGNLTGMSGARSAQLRYDYRNQMVEYLDVSSVPTHTHVYRYDVLGRRIAKVVDLGGVSEVVTQYFYSESHVVEEQNGLNAVKATYVRGRGIDEILNMRRSGVNYYFHSDDMGNVVKITNTSAAVVENYEYRDYGEVLDGTALTPFAVSGISNALFFTGARLDSETGFYHLRSRYMDPQIGRFTTRDAIGIWGDVKNRGNGHTYAACNPWSVIDPLGTAGWFVELMGKIDPDVWEVVGSVGAATVGFGNDQLGGLNDKLGALVHGQEKWDQTKVQYKTEMKFGEGASQVLDTVNLAKGALKTGIKEAVGAAAKHSDDLVRVGEKAVVAADKAADASKALKVETTATSRASTAGGKWTPGDSPHAPTRGGNTPSDSTVKRREWKNEAESPTRSDFTPEDMDRMATGQPPQRFNPDKGGIESMERSHEPIPKREGGTDTLPKWPQEHAAVDPHRKPGY